MRCVLSHLRLAVALWLLLVPARDMRCTWRMFCCCCDDQAELEASKRAPSEAQTAEYKALMDRFVHSEEERARLFVSLSAAQRQLQHLQKVNSDTQARSLQLQASLASSGATPAPKLRAEDRVRVEDSVIAAAVQRETAELRGQMEGVLTDNGLLKVRAVWGSGCGRFRVVPAC